MIKLFNTFGRKLEEFKPLKKGELGLYTCGPTVYNYAHIGNLRTYVFEDLLKRMFLYNGYKVKHIMNITDVGHLTGDVDTGEEKLETGAKREGKTVWEVAEFYTKAFQKDISLLNILPPSVWCKATEHIKDQIELIQKLEKKGFTYKTDHAIYYDVTKFKNYTKLSGQKLEEKEVGAREDVVVDKEKKHPADFSLWFFTVGRFKNHTMRWPSPWGVGFPGWHIECSAMSTTHLGEHIDIHCGGIDHIPVHHTNEIAQSEGAFDHKWVNYWLHGEFLVLEKEKMAKSGGNFITLQTLLDKGYSPLDYRYFCLNAQYRTQLKFSFEALDAAKNAFEKLKNRVLELKKDASSKNTKNKEKYETQFMKTINDDLNIPKALGLVWEMLKDDSIGNKEKLDLLFNFDEVLGLNLRKVKEKTTEVPEEIEILVQKREEARKKKDFASADRLRKEIAAKGYVLEDGPQGPKVKKI